MPDEAPQEVQRNARAVLFVPGFSTLAKGEPLERLMLNGIRSLRARDIVSEDKASCLGLTGSRITFSDGAVDFFELYWLDLAQHLAKAPPVVRLFVGIPTVLWFMGPLLNGRLRTARGWLRPLIANAFVLAMWTFTLIVGAIAQAFSFIPHLDGAAKVFAASGPPLLAAAAVFTYLGLNADDIMDLSYIVKRYLQGRRDTDGFSLSEKTRTLIEGALQRIDASNAYADVTLVGHSFGGMLAARALGADGRKHKLDLRFVTTGSFFEFAVNLKSGVRDSLNACAEAVEHWDDFWSTQDNFSSDQPTIAQDEHPNYHRRKVEFTSTGTPYLGGAHAYYYAASEVIETILARRTHTRAVC